MYQCVMKNYVHSRENLFRTKRCGMCIEFTNVDCGQCTFCLESLVGLAEKAMLQKRKCLSLTTHCQPKVAVIL